MQTNTCTFADFHFVSNVSVGHLRTVKHIHSADLLFIQNISRGHHPVKHKNEHKRIVSQANVHFVLTAFSMLTPPHIKVVIFLFKP